MLDDTHGTAPAGSLDELREEAMNALGLCAFHATLAVDQFSVLADAGGFYNARRATAHLRMAIDVLKMMHALQAAADGVRAAPPGGHHRRGEPA